MRDIDQLFKPETLGQSLDRELLLGKLVHKNGDSYAKIDGEKSLWGPIKGMPQTAIDADTKIIVGVAQDGDVWFLAPVPVGGGGGGGDGGLVYTKTIGDGSSQSFTVTHNFNTKSLIVAVYRTASPYDLVITEVEYTSVNTITIKTTNVPNSNEYTVVVAGPSATLVNGGGGGSGDKNYIHNQTSPNTIWNIAHNLDKFGAVSVVDSGGSVVIPNVSYVDANNVQLTFGSATSGKAYVN